jgi:hypothetical protein
MCVNFWPEPTPGGMVPLSSISDAPQLVVLWLATTTTGYESESVSVLSCLLMFLKLMLQQHLII